MIDLIVLLSLTALVLTAYMNSLNGEFVYDDHAVLAACDVIWDPVKHAASKKPYVNQLEGIGRLRDLIEHIIRQHRHILYWSYHRDARIHGKTERLGWHSTNVALHAIAACLVYALLRAFFAPVNAGLGAVVFAVHPMATSSAALVYARSSLLCGVFYLSGLLAAMIGGWAWGLVPIFFIAGWLSKQEILMLPVAVALTVWLIR